ncbi:MAG: hypothetical protein HY646_03755 [Acidobacteria bacterium]|nr:hypothetical protein [Acidobacteriota bacterium]
MRRTILVFGVLAIALVFSLATTAQEKKDAGEVQVTGCFNKADTEGLFVITDETSGKKITVSGDPAMLARHANNHKVTLTGTMAKEKDKEVLKATNLRMLALCQ